MGNKISREHSTNYGGEAQLSKSAQPRSPTVAQRTVPVTVEASSNNYTMYRDMLNKHSSSSEHKTQNPTQLRARYHSAMVLPVSANSAAHRYDSGSISAVSTPRTRDSGYITALSDQTQKRAPSQDTLRPSRWSLTDLQSAQQLQQSSSLSKHDKHRWSIGRWLAQKTPMARRASSASLMHHQKEPEQQQQQQLQLAGDQPFNVTYTHVQSALPSVQPSTINVTIRIESPTIRQGMESGSGPSPPINIQLPPIQISPQYDRSALPDNNPRTSANLPQMTEARETPPKQIVVRPPPFGFTELKRSYRQRDEPFLPAIPEPDYGSEAESTLPRSRSDSAESIPQRPPRIRHDAKRTIEVAHKLPKAPTPPSKQIGFSNSIQHNFSSNNVARIAVNQTTTDSGSDSGNSTVNVTGKRAEIFRDVRNPMEGQMQTKLTTEDSGSSTASDHRAMPYNLTNQQKMFRRLPPISSTEERIYQKPTAIPARHAPQQQQQQQQHGTSRLKDRSPSNRYKAETTESDSSFGEPYFRHPRDRVHLFRDHPPTRESDRRKHYQPPPPLPARNFSPQLQRSQTKESSEIGGPNRYIDREEVFSKSLPTISAVRAWPPAHTPNYKAPPVHRDDIANLTAARRPRPPPGRPSGRMYEVRNVRCTPSINAHDTFIYSSFNTKGHYRK